METTTLEGDYCFMTNYFRRYTIMTVMLLLFGCIGFMTIQPVSVYAESDSVQVEKKSSRSKSNKKHKESAMVASVHQGEFLEVCKAMGKNLNKRGFRYGYSSRARSYRSALKHRKVATCATYVSWCLQEYGLLKRGTLYYNRGHGVPSRRHWDNERVDTIRKYKRAKHANLQPGDVVSWATGKAHICIYAGKDKSGRMVWYDAGRHQSTYGHCAGSRYKVVSATRNSFLDNRKVGYILRIK